MRFLILAFWSTVVIVYGSYEDAIADKIANAEFISASDKLNSITEEQLNGMLPCSSFSEAGSCDPTAVTGTCKWCVDTTMAEMGLPAKTGLRFAIGKAKCPPQKSFPPKLRDTYKWVMAPQKFGKRRVCEAKDANPEIHDVLHAKSQVRALDNALASSSATVDGTAALSNSKTSMTSTNLSTTSSTSPSSDKHMFGLDRKILIFAASAGAFVVLVGLVVCISQR